MAPHAFTLSSHGAFNGTAGEDHLGHVTPLFKIRQPLSYSRFLSLLQGQAYASGCYSCVQPQRGLFARTCSMTNRWLITLHKTNCVWNSGSCTLYTIIFGIVYAAATLLQHRLVTVCVAVWSCVGAAACAHKAKLGVFRQNVLRQ